MASAAYVSLHTDCRTPDAQVVYAIPVFPVAVVHSSACTAGTVPEADSRSQVRVSVDGSTNPCALHTLLVELDKLST